MFSAHGKWKIEVKNNYVLQWFSGCWNEEAAIQYSQEFQEKTAHLAGTQWAIFSFFDDWELGVPEIEPHLIAHCQRFKDNGCVRDCHVYTPEASKRMQLENIVPQTEGNYQRQVFDNEADAIAWMNSGNFVVDTNDFL
ncbi:MAG: hypothetical protein ACPG52_14000 [Cognaticolwellia sp.]